MLLQLQCPIGEFSAASLLMSVRGKRSSIGVLEY